MPITYNGIGTRYYGKRNAISRVAPCHSCGQSATLTSYDTSLCFCVVFIPLIPLGRKRIIDQCSRCRRHYVMPLHEWETKKQLEVSGAMEEFRASATPENAIKVHQHLTAFHQHAEAEEFRGEMTRTFSGNAKVQAYLGAACSREGKFSLAAEHYRQALQLRPDLPESRIGLAIEEIRNNRLDEARTLLQFLAEPGAAQLYSLEPLERLAFAYQRARKHVEALDLFGKLQIALPSIAQHKAFRKAVRVSEKALKRETILPKKKFSWKSTFTPTPSAGGPRVTWTGLAVVAAIVVIGLAIWQISGFYARHHRQVFIVNGFSEPMTVEVRGVGKVSPRGNREALLVVPEGRYHASVTGPVRAEIDFDVHSDSAFGDPVWVINPGGAALLMKQDITYAKNPPPGGFSLFFGNQFFALNGVTHPFKSLPETVQLKAGETRTLSDINIYREDRRQAFWHFYQRKNFGEVIRFLEWQLSRSPNDEWFCEKYVETVQSQNQPERGENFLRAGLTNRPVAMEWHRAYQNVVRAGKRWESLPKQYDDFLKGEPNNSALLYLRGRVEPDGAAAHGFFVRALQLDPNNAYAHFAIGYDEMCSGHWTVARSEFNSAHLLAPKTEGFTAMLELARTALRDFQPLEAEARDQLKRDPSDFGTVTRLVEILAAEGKSLDVQQAMDTYQRVVRAEAPNQAALLMAMLKYHAFYALGDFTTLEALSKRDRTAAGQSALHAALVEQSKLSEIDTTSKGALRDPFDLLAVSIAATLANDNKGAEAMRDRALPLLEPTNPDYRNARLLLDRSEPPTRKEVEELKLYPIHKAILLTALATKHRNERLWLLEAAAPLIVQRTYPFHLLQRANHSLR